MLCYKVSLKVYSWVARLASTPFPPEKLLGIEVFGRTRFLGGTCYSDFI